MGNKQTTQRSLGMNYVLKGYSNDPKWKQYGIELDITDSDGKYCKAVFPKDWCCKNCGS